MLSNVCLITFSKYPNFLNFTCTNSSRFAAAILCTYFALTDSKLISAIAASARSSVFELRSGQSLIQLIITHHQALCPKAGSRSPAPQHSSITCFPFRSRVSSIFLQTIKHSYSSSSSSPFSHKPSFYDFFQ